MSKVTYVENTEKYAFSFLFQLTARCRILWQLRSFEMTKEIWYQTAQIDKLPVQVNTSV